MLVRSASSEHVLLHSHASVNCSPFSVCVEPGASPLNFFSPQLGPVETTVALDMFAPMYAGRHRPVASSAPCPPLSTFHLSPFAAIIGVVVTPEADPEREDNALWEKTLQRSYCGTGHSPEVC